MTGLARETAALRDTVSDAVQRQLDGLSAGFRESTADVAGIWARALDGQQRANETLANDLRVSLDQFASTFEQRSAALMDGMSTRMEASAGKLSDVWDGALSRQERAGEKLAGDNQQALAAAAAALERQSAALVQAVSQSHADLQAALMARDEQRLAAWNASLGSVSASLRQEWEQAAAQTAGRQQEICDALALTAQRISDHTQLQAGETIAEISRLVQAAADAPKAAAALQAELAARDQDRLQAWTASLENMTAALRQEWQQAGAEAASRQREICDALSLAAQNISEQARTQASGTLAEINRLVDAAADAPKAALALQDELAARDRERLDAWSGSLAEMTAALRQEWQQAGADAASRQREICDALALAAQRISEQTQAQASGTLAEINRLVDAAADAPKAALALQGELAARDRERLDAWSGSLAEMAAALRQEWQQAGADAASRQREICDALLLAAQDISEQGRAQASGTLAEINRLVDAAAEAPRPPSPCRPSWWPATRPAWTRGPARWPRWPQRCARNGSRPAPMPPAASSRSARRWPTPPARSRINRAPTPATRWPRSTAWSMPPPRRQGRRRPAKRPGGPRRGPPGCLDRIAGRHGRRAARGMAADRRRHRQPPAGNLRRAGPGRARHLRAHPHPRQRHHRRDRAPGAGRVRSAARRRRGHRRTASEAVRQPGPRQRHAGRARPPARHARDPAGRRQPRIHRATRRRGRAGRHHLGTDGPGGRAVLGTRRIRNRQAGRDLGPGHRQRRRSGQPGRGLRRRGAAVQRVQRQAGHAARTHRGGAGQVHRPGRRTALLLRVAGARSGGPEPDVAKADH